jgi:hypothetical protein
MAVDRVDENDTADRRAGPPADRTRPAEASLDRQADAPADKPAISDLDADQERKVIARRLHRVLVDHTYGVASDAWAEAVPELRAAWENHERRYPERNRASPRTTPDGAWVAGEHRRLTPEQNAEATKACADLADEGRRDILPALKRVESTNPARHLAGLEHLLKGEDRLKEKIADFMQSPDATVRDALGLVPDAVRFTLKYSPQRYADGVLQDVDLLKAEGFELLKSKNSWPSEQYKGINTQWRRPETGLRFEVQFHTPESLEAKELTHGAYERIRSSAPPEEREELEQFQRTINAFIVTPERTAEIKDYPEKKHG